jgi:predicted N-acetyltransferase YhbS
MVEYNIKFISDDQVTEELDQQLRDLLVLCFPETAHIFGKQRHYHEPPQFRWCLFGDDDSLVAHVALHIKKVKTEFDSYDMGGIGEVFVHPDFRRKGITRMLLKQILDYLRERGFAFSMLFGDTEIYSSSGFKEVTNKIRYFDQKTREWKIEKDPSAMYLELGQVNWLDGIIDICGPTF